jgi:hypothetical protein
MHTPAVALKDKNRWRPATFSFKFYLRELINNFGRFLRVKKGFLMNRNGKKSVAFLMKMTLLRIYLIAIST